MRPVLFWLIGLMAATPDLAFAQIKLAPKAAPNETRYFTSMDGLMDGNADVVPSDNSDLSEQEVRDNQSPDDGIQAAPKDFSTVSPESIGVRLKLDAVLECLRTLRGQDLEVSLNSLTVSCDALRVGEQTII